MGALPVIGLFIVLITLTTYYLHRIFSYWERRGVPSIRPLIPFGNFKELGSKYFLGSMTQKLYNEMKGKAPFCGIYMYLEPMVLALDVDFIKTILIKDFPYFHDRGLYFNEKDDPLSAHLFAIEGSKWRNLRSKLSPSFTSGKMKFMYPTILKIGNEFEDTLAHLLEGKESFDLEVKDMLARFTTDVIGECAFGIECNSLKDPNAEFRNMGRRVFEKSRNSRITNILMQTFQELSRFLKMRSTLEEVERFFINSVRETVRYREENDVTRNDFMDLMIRIKNGKKLNENDSDSAIGLSINEVAAQAFVFFLAGFETSSTVMTFLLYELALNKDIQLKARKEIKQVLERHGGQFSYEAMTDMTYITQILNESLRKYPPVGNLRRITSKDYNVPNTKLIIQKGTKILIPVHAVQHDPTYYPNPDEFNPDRFSAEQMNQRDNETFLSFGAGPRNCIGLRFGLMQARVGMVKLLSNFEFSICDKTSVPLQIDKKSIILSPAGGMWLNIKKV
ncbi:probable cytochrome P450 6a20 [Bradysia coprophila]|uniref:probable cytochrome P450 6a20 n=1 Tax=Bradysia coprophila TaxID=38358 RepID=UPI00187D9EB3|nr:probable cytochrome P450 6a20 [Bradysia coprophila]